MYDEMKTLEKIKRIHSNPAVDESLSLNLFGRD